MYISKKIREQVYNKFGGKCAYTGQPLDDKWQVDHAEPLIRKQRFQKAGWFYKGTKNPVENSRRMSEEELASINAEYRLPRVVPDGYVYPQNHCIENMIPAISIINHYKGGLTVEEFRRYISDLHVRLAKLPKNTSVIKTESRIKYLFEVAGLFGITPEKPFTGKFYFETNNTP